MEGTILTLTGILLLITTVFRVTVEGHPFVPV
jgi:hypothetical protein